MNLTRVRIRETGQVLDLVPAVATAMILGRTAEEVKPLTAETKTGPRETTSAIPETTAMSTETAERTVAPAQRPSAKPIFPRRNKLDRN